MNKSLYHNNLAAMGTRLDIVLPYTDTITGDTIFRQIKNEVIRLEKKLSRFLSDSELSYINRTAVEKPVKVDQEWITILETCKDYYTDTCFYFDITLRKNEKEKEHKSQGTDNIYIDKKDATVHLIDPEIKIDLGGFGKGYTLDRINNILRSNDIKSGLISFGESSVLAVGKHPHGNHWNIGIRHLFKPGENVYVINLENNNLSSSGMLSRKGKLYYRKTALVNPLSGKPVESISTISVESVKASDAEVLSTALYVAPRKKKKRILSNFPGSKAVEAKYGNDKKVSIFVL